MDDYVVGTTQEERASGLHEEARAASSSTDVLNRIPVHKISSKGGVEYVSATDSIYSFIDVCTANHVQSAPVLHVGKQSHTAFVDVLDVVAHTVEVHKKHAEGLPLEEANKMWGSINCRELADKSTLDPFSPIGEETPLLDVIDKFIKFKAHRLPIIDSSGELVHLISQLRVIEFVEQHIGKFKGASSTVESLQLGYKFVVFSVNRNDALIDGFKTILSHRVTGLAVVDDDGKCVGNLSASDVKHIIKDGQVDLARLARPVKDYLEDVSDSSPERVIPGLICVTPATTLEELVLKFSLTKVHRVYVVDLDGKLLGIISTVDLLKQLLLSEK